MKLRVILPVLLGAAVFSGVGCQGKKKSTGISFSGEAMVGSSAGVSYEDENFRFTIRGLDSKWRLLGEQERHSLLPDAAALTARVGGAYGAVIVEPYPSGNLESYTEMIASNMQTMLGRAELGDLRDVDFPGGKAKSRTLKGVMQGITFDYELRTFVHQGMGYQVLAWMPENTVEREVLEEFMASVSIVDGIVKIPPPPAAPDTVGVGNRTRGGSFESAVSRLTAAPVPGWGLMWGQSLAVTGDDAEIGINRPDLGLYVTVSHQAVEKGQEERFIKSLGQTFPEEVKTVDPVEWSFCGEPVKFQGMLMEDGPGVRVYLGHAVRHGRGFRVKAWHLEQGDREFTQEFGEGMQAFGMLDDAAWESLRAELEVLEDGHGTVGEDFSVRNGVYRGFAEGVVWKRPQGFWQIDAGDAARSRNEACSMHATHVESGLSVQLITEDLESGDLNPEIYHEAVCSLLADSGFEKISTAPEPVVVDGQDLRRSRFSIHADDSDILYQVVTQVEGRKARQLICFGPPSAMTGTVVSDARALAGFSFPGKKLRAIESRGGVHRDVRMGYEMRPPGGMSPAPQSGRSVIQKLGSNAEFRGKDGMVSHMALQAGGAGNDASIATTMVGEIFKLNLDRSTSAGSAERTETIGGLPATIRSGVSGSSHIHIAVFRRGGTLHMGTIAASSERRADQLLAEYIASFSLIP